MKLTDLADIRTGLVLYRKENKNFYFEKPIIYKLLTLGNITNNGFINLNNTADFYSKETIDRIFFTKPNDILIRLSNPNTAVVIDEKTQGLLIPSQFAIIRINNDKINATYLWLLLNSEKIQHQLARARNGTIIQTLKTTTIKNIDIKLKPINEQKKIADFEKLYKKKIYIQEKITEKEKLKNKAIIRKLIKEI